MKQLIDQIYGVETRIIENAQKRFAKQHSNNSSTRLQKKKRTLEDSAIPQDGIPK